MIADLLDRDSVASWLRQQGQPELAELLPSELPGLSIGQTLDRIGSDVETFSLAARILRNQAKQHDVMAEMCRNLAGELLKRCKPSD